MPQLFENYEINTKFLILFVVDVSSTMQTWLIFGERETVQETGLKIPYIERLASSFETNNKKLYIVLVSFNSTHTVLLNQKLLW